MIGTDRTFMLLVIAQRVCGSTPLNLTHAWWSTLWYSVVTANDTPLLPLRVVRWCGLYPNLSSDWWVTVLFIYIFMICWPHSNPLASSAPIRVIKLYFSLRNRNLVSSTLELTYYIWQDDPEGNSWLLGPIRVVLRKFIPKNWNPPFHLPINRHTTCKICSKMTHNVTVGYKRADQSGQKIF